MAFTTRQPGPLGVERMQGTQLEEKATAAPPAMAAWPSRSAANFSRLSQDPWVKMIQTPKAYHATHDTMPPPGQVISMEPTHSLLRAFYQATDTKLSGKRGNTEHDAPSSLRPAKVQRPL